MAHSRGAAADDRLLDAPVSSSVGGRPRHRAPDGDDVDVLTVTLPIVADWSGYGRHAAAPRFLPGDGVPAGGDRRTSGTAGVVPTVVTVTVASPTADREAAAAKLRLRVREQLAGTGRAAPAHDPGLAGLVVTGPHESTDCYGRTWFWFRGTVEVGEGRSGGMPVVQEPAVAVAPAWPLRPVPRVLGSGWECHLPTAAAAAQVRRDLRTRLRKASAAGHCTVDAGEDLLLAFEELTSNAFRHGGGTVDVTIAATAAGWLLVVGDAAPDRPPVPAVAPDRALGGMGLEMVARLSREFGWQPARGRKDVWAELPSHR